MAMKSDYILCLFQPLFRWAPAIPTSSKLVLNLTYSFNTFLVQILFFTLYFLKLIVFWKDHLLNSGVFQVGRSYSIYHLFRLRPIWKFLTILFYNFIPCRCYLTRIPLFYSNGATYWKISLFLDWAWFFFNWETPWSCSRCLA